MLVAEVVDTLKCFKSSQKDENGNPLPLGSIQVRIGSGQNNLGQVRNVWCRPATFNGRRIPLIGEIVSIVTGPVNDWSTSGYKNTGFLYESALNATDDLVMHQFPRLWKRKGLVQGGGSGERENDREEPGKTFPKNPKIVRNIQPFEGDDLYEGRFGHSMRFGSTVDGDLGMYDFKPTWKGGANGDPIFILRVKKPTEGTVQTNSSAQLQQPQNKYTIEDIGKDESSIYLTSTQNLPNLKIGFDKNTEVKQAANWKSDSQIVVDSGRVVINARKEKLFLVGKEKVIVTGKKVLFQSDKYKVDLDELMDWLQKWVKADKDLASGTKNYSTPSGPTGPATSVSDYIKLSTTDFQKFKMP